MESMRTQYSRYLKAKPSGSDGFVTPRQSWMLHKMHFLEMHMRKRPSKSNLSLDVRIYSHSGTTHVKIILLFIRVVND